MNETEKIIYLIVTKLQQAIDASDGLAADDIDRVKIKRLKNPFRINSTRPEDYWEDVGLPLMLIPFEKLRGELSEMLPNKMDGER